MIVTNPLNTNKTSAISTSTSQKAASKVSGASFNACMEQVTQTEEKEVSLNDIFEKAAQTYNVPVNLLKAIGYAESSFRPDATSHCGAQGIMQLMPGTAKSLGVTDAYDPEQNIMGGAKYISQMINKYDGNVNLALAAYNAGSGNVAKYGGIPPFKETQNYVVKVNQYMKQELNADTKVVVGGTTTQYQVPSNYVPVFDNSTDEDLILTQDKLDEIFSYDSYELLLKLLQQEKEENEENKQDTSLSQISMNPSVANLLKSAEVQGI